MSTIGLAVASLAGIVGLIALAFFARAAARKGTSEAGQAAADAWKSLADAHASEIQELRKTLGRQEGKIEELTKSRDRLEGELAHLRTLPDYSEMVKVVQQLVETMSDAQKSDQRLRDHAHNHFSAITATNHKLDELLLRVAKPGRRTARS